MKKICIFCLVTILILTNSCIAWADIGLIGISTDNIDLGEDFVNKDFSRKITFHNNGSAYRKVTIEVDYNDLGLKVDSTNFTLRSNETKEITLTGHFPAYNGNFSATLTVKDDLNYTNDQVIFITGYAKPKDSGGTMLPAPKNIKVMISVPPTMGFISWDAVPKAEGYKVCLPKPLDKCITTNETKVSFQPQLQWYLDGKFTISVVAKDKNGKYGHKATYTYTY